MRNLPKLNNADMVLLKDLRYLYPREFYTNQTKFFQGELIRYVREKRVWRISVMGETRSGKSEVGSTIAFWYVAVFNKYMRKNHFADLDLFKKGQFKPQLLKFTPDNVYQSEQHYKYDMRDKSKENRLIWGQVSQIDEEKTSSGGVGSMSEMIEMTNLNNIIAKWNQSEIYCQPLKLETRNTPYGLKVIKKDLKLRENWCMLFKTDQTPSGGTDFKFLGWVCIPLHNNEKFRDEYNDKKDLWINDEIEGSGDVRMNKRSEIAQLMVDQYPEYFKRTASGKRFEHGKGKLLVLLMRLIRDKKTQNWNELEREYIIEEAQMISDEYGQDTINHMILANEKNKVRVAKQQTLNAMTKKKKSKKVKKKK